MSTVKKSLDEGVLTVTIDRPEARNALDNASYRALSDALAGADGDAAVRAVILTGAGGHFTAGNDLRDFMSGELSGEPAGIAFLRSLVGFGKPLLAAVEGVAVGIGTTMLFHCDFAFAGRSARLRMPFVPLGLCPEGGSSVLLARLVGARRAADWLLTGREISGAEAAEAGLLNAAVDDGGALARARETARQLASLPPEAVRAAKELLRAPQRPEVLAAIDRELVRFVERLGSEEAQAAFAAFFARRAK